MLLIPLVFIAAIGGSLVQAKAKYESWPAQLRELLLDEKLLDWKPPQVLTDSYKYYHAGYDNEDRPVWIMEWGRWDLKKVIDMKLDKEFDKFNRQQYANIARSIIKNETDDVEYKPETTVIIDCEGLTAERLANQKVLGLIFQSFRVALPYATSLADDVFVINTHFIAQNLISLLRPVLGELLDQVQIFGTDKDRWIPALRAKIPKNSLPEWYGGTKNFKPVIVHG